MFRPSPSGVLFALSLALLSTSSRTAVAAEGDKSARPGIATSPPLIDGLLDDAVWRAAPLYSDFVERSPRLRAEPSERTVFRMLVDGDALYVGIECGDSQPELVRARSTERDSQAIFDDDALTIAIDPLRDRRTVFGFALSVAGGRMDYRGVNEQSQELEVDLVWESAAARTPDGWSAELRIPWSTLGIDPADPPVETGLAITRHHSRLHATWDWALIAPPHWQVSASQYGALTGLPEQLAQAPEAKDRSAWAFLPWVLYGFDDPPDRPLDVIAKGGFDVEADLGAGFAATLTINTDFAQVEVDDVVTNLDRFDLFLPEKRDFFLKDGDLFVAGEQGWAALFHSRTIGLASAGAGGVEVPIVGGLKLGGRTAGGFRLGALSVLTRPGEGEASELPWRLDSVLRLQQTFGKGSSVGFLATHRQSLEDTDEVSLDLALDTHWFHEHTPLVVRAFVAGSYDDGLAKDGELDASLLVNAQWRGEAFNPTLGYAYFGPEFKAELGFFQRVGVQDLWAFLPGRIQIGAGGLERLELWEEIDVYLDAKGSAVLDWRADTGVALIWDAGYWVRVWNRLGAEKVGAFAIAGEYEVAAGEHGRTQLRVAAGTPNTEAVSLELSGVYGEYFGGTFAGGGFKLVARPGTWLRAEASGEVAWIELPSGAFSAPTFNVRLASGLTHDLELSGFVGWSGLQNLLSLQSRLRWTLAPGNDLFAVWELALEDDSGRAGTHSFVTKLALRFP